MFPTPKYTFANEIWEYNSSELVTAYTWKLTNRLILSLFTGLYRI